MFTDDDLKRLKEKGCNPEYVWNKARTEKLEALLARLEAAEDFLKTWQSGGGLRNALEAWKKTAGKA